MAIRLGWLIVVMAVATFGLIWAFEPKPKFDLLFSVDRNGLSYSDPGRPIVIRLIGQKAKVVLTAQPIKDWGTDVPQLFICQAANGELRELTITLPDAQRMGEFPVPISIPELEAPTIENTRVAPDGYSPAGFEVGQTYAITSELMDASYYGLSDIPFAISTELSKDPFTHCLKQLKSSTDPIVHFIGWVIPRSAKSQ